MPWKESSVMDERMRFVKSEAWSAPIDDLEPDGRGNGPGIDRLEKNRVDCADSIRECSSPVLTRTWTTTGS
jgi:hypothetical protein